jgi:hypothetical protein
MSSRPSREEQIEAVFIYTEPMGEQSLGLWIHSHKKIEKSSTLPHSELNAFMQAFKEARKSEIKI